MTTEEYGTAQEAAERMVELAVFDGATQFAITLAEGGWTLSYKANS